MRYGDPMNPKFAYISCQRAESQRLGEMGLFLTLLVRDEEDIVEANIRYHLEQGIDHIIVTDNLSADRTTEIVQDFVRQGVATYLHEPDTTYKQSQWVSRMASMACEAGAKWIINNDADEFWLTTGGETLGAWFNRLRWPNIAFAPRHDFVCIDDETAPFWKRMIYRKTESTNALGFPLPPKAAHRAARRLVVEQGNHDVKGFMWKRPQRLGLEILHFPLRSSQQYIRKIRNGGSSYAANSELSKSTGMAWRRQYAELCETGSIHYLDENVLSQDRIDQLLADGAIVEDRRLSDFFSALGREIGCRRGAAGQARAFKGDAAAASPY